MSRIVLWPGEMLSKRDRDIHYIGEAALLRLYDVEPGTPFVVGGQPGFRQQPNDVNLRPRFNGDYKPWREVEPQP